MTEPTSPIPSSQAPTGGSPVTPGWRTDFRLVMGASALSVLAVNATRPIVTYQALALGASTFEIGLVQSAFSVLPAVTAVAVGRIVDRGGEARYLTLAMVLYTLGSLGAGLAGSLILLALAQLVFGMGHIINLVSSQAMIANRGPREQRDARFGSYAVANSFGQLGGPVLAGVIAGSAVAGAAAAGSAVTGYRLDDGRLVFLAAALATGVGVALATAILLRNRERDRALAAARPEEPGEHILRAAARVLRRPGMPAAMTVSIIVISVLEVLIAYLPAYGEATGLAVAAVGFLLSVRAGASLVARVFMGRTIALLGRERTLAGSMAVAGVGMGLLPITNQVEVLVVAMILAGLGLGMCQPMTIAWVAQRSPRAERATALGVRLTGNRGSLLIVPATMGAIAGAAGILAIFWILAIALLAGAVLALRTPFDELVERRGERAGGGG